MEILFICTGNTCRSPIAEALFRQAAREAGCGARATSAGMSVFAPAPAAVNAARAALELGADLSGHVAKQVDSGLMAGAGAVYCMTAEHMELLIQMFPEHEQKIKLLDPGLDIDDPFGGSPERYRRVAAQIKAAVDRTVGELKT